jgi:hypothetical protein
MRKEILGGGGAKEASGVNSTYFEKPGSSSKTLL